MPSSPSMTDQSAKNYFILYSCFLFCLWFLLLCFPTKGFCWALLSFSPDREQQILHKYFIDLIYCVESFAHHIDPPFCCSLMLISVMCSCLLYEWGPDCQFLCFAAFQTRLAVTGEMSLLYIKSFVCLGKLIFIVFPLIHFQPSMSSTFPSLDV